MKSRSIKSVGKTYKKIANFSIAPIKFSVNAIAADGDYSTAGHIIGWLSLPWTVITTVVTLPVGIAGLIGYSVVAPFHALRNMKHDKKVETTKPIEITSDLKHNEEDIVAEKTVKRKFKVLKKDSTPHLLQGKNKEILPVESIKITQTRSTMFSPGSKQGKDKDVESLSALKFN